VAGHRQAWQAAEKVFFCPCERSEANASLRMFKHYEIASPAFLMQGQACYAPRTDTAGLFQRTARTYLKIADPEKCRHTRESGYPEKAEKHWIPVFTGMTPKGGRRQKPNLR